MAAADPWAQFKDADAAAPQPQGDEWAQFADADHGPAANAAQAPPEEPGYLSKLASGYEDAIDAGADLPDTSGVGRAETALSLATGAAAPIPGAIDYALGKIGWKDPNNPTGSYAGARDKYVYQPRSQEGQGATRMAGALLKPAADTFGMIGRGYGEIAKVAGASPETAEDVAAMVPDAMGVALAAKGPRTARVAKQAGKLPKPPIPTKEQLATDSKAAYKRAEDAGIAVSPDSFSKMKLELLDQLEKEGIDPDLHPDTTAALKRIASTDGPVTLEKLETLRKIANDAKGSIKPADQRLAGQVVDHIDDYVDSLGESDVVAGDPAKASALKEARDLYSRKKKTDEIDQLIHRAELSAPNFSASGMENALRTEFRGLAKNERKMRRFTAEERAAIEKVAQGGPLQNAMRLLGKLAPTGVVSGGVSAGAGLAIGGPAGAVILPAIGGGARYAATRMTSNAAKSAQELMRRGPNKAPPMVGPPAPVTPTLPSVTPAAAIAPGRSFSSLSPEERRRLIAAATK